MAGITLESVEQAFHDWRARRNSRAELIPKNLWCMAVQLYPQHKRTIICRRLGLSGSQFKQHLEASNFPVLDSGFVLTSADSVKEKSMPNATVQLTIQGKERTLTFAVDVHALGHILPYIGVLI